MNTSFIFIPLLVLFSSRIPTNPYGFQAPNFEDLLPFSDLDLQRFKEKGVKKIEKLETEQYKTVYYFNEKGQLTLEEVVYQKKKKAKIEATTRYQYNNAGLLTLKHTQDNNYGITYDSIVYDQEGHLSYYYSYDELLITDKVYDEKFIRFHLKLYSKDQKQIILADSSQSIPDGYPVWYTLNQNNQFIRIDSQNQLDSVSIEHMGIDEYLKKYWYKEKGIDSTFKIGRISTYKDSLIQKNIVHDKVLHPSNIYLKALYHYDSSNRLLRKEYFKTLKHKEFYVYHQRTGLLSQKIILDRNNQLRKIDYQCFFD